MPFTYSQFIDLGAVYEFPGGAVTTDFDQDGLPELTFIRFTVPGGIDQPLPIFEVQRDGTLINIAPEVIVGGSATSDFGREILVDDINGDGYDDLIIADHGFDADPFPGARNTVLISNGKGRLIDRSDRPF